MRNILVRSPHDTSFSKRHFQWIIGKFSGSGGEYEELEATLTTTNSDSSSYDEEPVLGATAAASDKKKKSSSSTTSAAAAVSKLMSVLTVAVTGKNRPTNVTGTLYGHRRSHIHFAFQFNSKSVRTVLLEVAMPTSTLVKEMASGPLRIVLKCERKGSAKPTKLLEETLWRAYCNGKKCGYAVRREIGVEDLKVLKAVEPVSMGAGVLPGATYGGDGEGELMYMRAKFERVVGSKDSEVFYMINPDGNSGPELSVYLLRV